MNAERAEIVADLVAQCLERLGTGAGDLALEEICADHLDLLEEVRVSVEFAGLLPKLQNVGFHNDSMLGVVLGGRYRVDGRLGSGAMGVVYSGTDLDLGRRVAIKVVHSRFLDREQSLARFDREAAALAAISHDSVVTIYDRGVTDDGAPFLVMELIEGISCSEILHLAERHRDGDSTEWLGVECGIEEVREASLLRQMVRWVASLASGLEAAHAAGIYHRDVKPSNIMIRLDGRAVLLDFGIAAIEDEKTLTRTEAAVGTPAYMAPEVLLGSRRKSTPGQDVYGLAATLYHLLTLEAPYRGTPTEILAALATREPVPAFKVRPGLPRDAQAILDHGLARSPGARYASPGAFEKDLRALLAFRPVSVRPTSTLTRTLRRIGRSKIAVGAVLATLVIGAALGANELRRRHLARADEAFAEAYDHVPANLGIVSPANRFLASEDARLAVGEVLDRLVDSGAGGPTPRLLRASFRLDHGDAAGAKSDMDALANDFSSDYTVALARRYRALKPDAQGVAELDVADLPAPETEADVYVYAFHLMRKGQYIDAIDPLNEIEPSRWRHAAELDLLLETIPFGRLLDQRAYDELSLLGDSFLDRLRGLEARFGGASAMSNHLAGYALRMQQRFALCLIRCDATLAQAPQTHVTLVNAAESARVLGLFDRALDYLDRGEALVPRYAKFRTIRSEVEAQLGRFDDARAAIETADFSPGRRGEIARAIALARVEAESVFHVFDQNPAEAAEAGARIRHLSQSIPDTDDLKPWLESIAVAADERDRRQLFPTILLATEGYPFSLNGLQAALAYWPDTLSTQDGVALRDWFVSAARLLGSQGSIPGPLSSTNK